MSAAQNSYAASVEIYLRDRPIGGAVCVAARIVVTAAHVVEGLDVADLSVVEGTPDAPRTNVLFIKKDPTLDVAAIHVEGDLRIESIRQPTSGESWQTKAPASRADLSGTVTSMRGNWENSFGKTVPALQLHVDQSVADFHGYSGSAVEARQDGATLAILVEQLPSRNGYVTRTSSANVLYAIPIVSACDALGVEPMRKLARTRAPLPAAMEYHEQVVASLRGYRSRLTAEGLQFVTPPMGTPWRPSALWSSLTEDNVGSVLLTGHGGVGKTRTLLEVGDIATSFGWDVIHVRGVNAARVADVISERVREAGSAPILLLSDYLNLAREIDLLALTELANSDEGRPRLRILATSRTGWELRHRHDPGMSRLTRVHLDPSDSDAYEVCKSIVRNIAPVATAKFGAATVLEVTGSRRPILAVLLGQIVETQVITTGRLPAALVSEDIASWLGDRLLEDNFVTSAPSEGIELPAHMIAAAICLASAPAEPERLVRIMSSAIGHENAEVASLTLERLQRFGWLIDVDGRLAAAHDVVVDKILESVVLHHDSGIVRQKTLHTMLNTARSSASAFSNVVASLERVLDERTAREETTLNIQSSSTEWLVGFSQEGTTLLPGTPVERARVVTQVLDSGLWTNGASERWASIGSDLLSTVEHDPASADAFLVACRTLEKDVIPPISERAVRWVSRSGAAVDEFVLNACLSRRDVYGETAEILLNLAIQSISPRAGDVTTDFTLRRLLRRTDLRPTDLVPVSEFAREWLELHGGSDHATHLISAVIDREDVREVAPDIWQLAYDKALSWIEAHPAMLDGALALESLIKSNFTGPHFDAKIWPRALEWLQNNCSEHSAVYVLGALLKSPWVRDDHADRIMSFTSEWVTDHLAGRGTTFLLKPLVSWELGQGDRDATTWDIVDEWFSITGDVENAAWILREAMRSRRASDPIAHRIWAQVRRWILRHGSRSDARLVLTDALAWQYLEEGSGAILSGAVERWLGLHLDRYECSYLMQSALESPLVDKQSSERILVLVDQWISKNVNAPALSHILQAAMERALKSGVDLTQYMWQRIDEWLEEYGDSPAAAYIIRTILKFADLPAERFIFVACCASKWLKLAHNTSTEVRVVRSLLSHYPSEAPGFEVVLSCVSSWLRAATPAPGPEVSHLLQELTEWMPSTEVWADTWTLAEKVLPLDDGKAGGYVIQRLLARHPPGEILRDESWHAICSWLTVHEASRHSAYTHMSVLAFGPLTLEQAESLWRGVNRWLALHSDEGATTLSFLRACINSPHLSRDALDIFWPILEKQFGALATRIKSLNTLVELASVSIYSDQERATFWACAMRWLDRFGASYDATFLIQALLKMKSSPVQQELLWEYISKWFLLYGTDEKAIFVYTVLLHWPGLANGRASRLVEVLKRWMHANAHSSRGTRLVISVIRSQHISHRQLVDFGSAARLWLSKQRGDQRRKEVLRVTSSRSISSNRSKVARAALALEK